MVSNSKFAFNLFKRQFSLPRLFDYCSVEMVYAWHKKKKTSKSIVIYIENSIENMVMSNKKRANEIHTEEFGLDLESRMTQIEQHGRNAWTLESTNAQRALIFLKKVLCPFQV